MKINFKFKGYSIKSFFSRFTSNVSWLFLIGLLIIVVLTIIEIKNSWDVAFGQSFLQQKTVNNTFQINNLATSTPSGLASTTPGQASKGLRIDFEKLEKVKFRIEQARSFKPDSDPIINPFVEIKK